MKYKQLQQNFSRMGKRLRSQPTAIFQMGHEPVIICNGKAVVDLAAFREELCNLGGGEVLVIGRAEDADIDLVKYLRKGVALNHISRYHCFIERHAVDGAADWYILYDCSVTSTVVMLCNPDAAPPAW